MRYFFVYITLFFAILFTSKLSAETIFESERSVLNTFGYARTGIGMSEGGAVQTAFIMPGAQSKYRLGNESDTYLEFTLDYLYKFGRNRDKSVNLVWTGSMYDSFGESEKPSFGEFEQLYIKVNNLLGWEESMWFGTRFYERRDIHMLDRYWLNPGQYGLGFGFENLFKRGSDEDIKFAAWIFKDDNLIPNLTEEIDTKLYNITTDLRWANKPISERLKFSLALNYTIRAPNESLGYETRQGIGVVAWTDYKSEKIKNTTALIVRQGANILADHGSGRSQKENLFNNNLVVSDLTKSYYVEINNDLLYEPNEDFALNVVALVLIRNFGTTPYWLYGDGSKEYLYDSGDMYYWFTLGARANYYLCDFFRFNVECSSEYLVSEQIAESGFLNKITFIPEFALSKGYFSRPVLRPFVTYAFWSDALRGQIGTSPTGAVYGDSVSGFNLGLQLEYFF